MQRVGAARPAALCLSALCLSALCLFPRLANAQTSLCAVGETTEWTCSASGRTHSVCSSKDLSATTGYMQYRVAKGTMLEARVPEDLRHPKGNFELSLMPRGASLSFSGAGRQYGIHEPLVGLALVDVSQDGKAISSTTCDANTETLTSTATQNRLRLVGIHR